MSRIGNTSFHDTHNRKVRKDGLYREVNLWSQPIIRLCTSMFVILQLCSECAFINVDDPALLVNEELQQASAETLADHTSYVGLLWPWTIRNNCIMGLHSGSRAAS